MFFAFAACNKLVLVYSECATVNIRYVYFKDSYAASTGGCFAREEDLYLHPHICCRGMVSNPQRYVIIDIIGSIISVSSISASDLMQF